MSGYPLVEQDGLCASVSTQRHPGKRWVSWVSWERDRYFARLHPHAAQTQKVPNDYPSEEAAVAAAYQFARERMTSLSGGPGGT